MRYGHPIPDNMVMQESESPWSEWQENSGVAFEPSEYSTIHCTMDLKPSLLPPVEGAAGNYSWWTAQ